MNHLGAIQISAQLSSLAVYGLLAVWFVAPWQQRYSRADALVAIVITYVVRYVTLLTYSAQRDGYPISDVAAFGAVAGDAGGAVAGTSAALE